MHERENVVEICFVTKGKGVVRNSNGTEESFVTGDRFIFPPNTGHEIENNSNTDAEFYFIRFKDK
ncbi:MAG TPA: cupin domain-containing protein [Candidatus Limnocylindrales bacterium]|nr:cupin domain-containing protein [Candidatus Limnocylindrales bacterium]